MIRLKVKGDNMEEYSTAKIHMSNWHEVYLTRNSKWIRVWHISLVNEPTDTTLLRQVEERLSTDEIRVEIAWKGKHLLAMVTTDRWGWDDDLFWYSYTILTTINDQVGEIESIQGEARNTWSPWSKSKERH
jgi:hypothetical protein